MHAKYDTLFELKREDTNFKKKALFHIEFLGIAWLSLYSIHLEIDMNC